MSNVHMKKKGEKRIPKLHNSKFIWRISPIINYLENFAVPLDLENFAVPLEEDNYSNWYDEFHQESLILKNLQFHGVSKIIRKVSDTKKKNWKKN